MIQNLQINSHYSLPVVRIVCLFRVDSFFVLSKKAHPAHERVRFLEISSFNGKNLLDFLFHFARCHEITFPLRQPAQFLESLGDIDPSLLA